MNIFKEKKMVVASLCICFITFCGPAVSLELVRKAIAVIRPTEGNSANGTVTFSDVNGAVHIIAEINGLEPGEHGFHIHEYGDCSASDASSAGGHFNPTYRKHGCPNSSEHHVGDLGNITANEKGYAKYDSINKDIKFLGTNGILGRSVVVHKGRDDCKTQPSGNSGASVGCGVIGISK